jgi:hypothetical protein
MLSISVDQEPELSAFLNQFVPEARSSMACSLMLLGMDVALKLGVPHDLPSLFRTLQQLASNTPPLIFKKKKPFAKSTESILRSNKSLPVFLKPTPMNGIDSHNVRHKLPTLPLLEDLSPNLLLQLK